MVRLVLGSGQFPNGQEFGGLRVLIVAGSIEFGNDLLRTGYQHRLITIMNIFFLLLQLAHVSFKFDGLV